MANLASVHGTPVLVPSRGRGSTVHNQPQLAHQQILSTIYHYSSSYKLTYVKFMRKTYLTTYNSLWAALYTSSIPMTD